MNRLAPVGILALLLMEGLASAGSFCNNTCGGGMAITEDYYPLEMKEHPGTGKKTSGHFLDYIDDLETAVNQITIEDMRREIIKLYRKYSSRNVKCLINAGTVCIEEQSTSFGEALVGIFLESYGIMLNFIYYKFARILRALARRGIATNRVANPAYTSMFF